MARGNKLGPWRVNIPDDGSNTDAAYEVKNSSGTTIEVIDYNGNLFNAGENVLSTDTKNAKLVVGQAKMTAGSSQVALGSSLSRILFGGVLGYSSKTNATVSGSRPAGTPYAVIHNPTTGTPTRLDLLGKQTSLAAATTAATVTYFAVGLPA